MDVDQIIELFEAQDPIALMIIVVGILLAVASIVALIVQIFLAISYIKYNKKKNSAGLTGQEAARRILDLNGLQHIKVTASGSIMFGNSYSHYFKKVRLRRRIWKKDSLTSLAMAAQKSSLAVLDKEGDEDMKKRVRLTPILNFGPLLFIPLIIVGAVLDLIISNTFGIITVVCTVAGILFYLYSFIMTILVLKTEKKAQDEAMYILDKNNMATADEIEDMKKLFKLYNIEYINNMVISLLELIYNVLRIVMILEGKGGASKGND